jgi:hypothetical protein
MPLVGCSETTGTSGNGGGTGGNGGSDPYGWCVQYPPESTEFHGVSFTDTNTGTVVGRSGTILRTTDVRGYSGSCDPFCARIADCFLADRLPNCAESCGCTVNEGAQVSAACETAVTDVNACVVALLSCEQVEAWLDSSPADDYPCKAADENVISICF